MSENENRNEKEGQTIKEILEKNASITRGIQMSKRARGNLVYILNILLPAGKNALKDKPDGDVMLGCMNTLRDKMAAAKEDLVDLSLGELAALAALTQSMQGAIGEATPTNTTVH